MRKDGNGIAGRIRRAIVRLVAPAAFLGLAVAGAAGPDPAAMRVSVRLRGPQGMDGGLVLALGQRLREVLRLAPGARLPVLVINWVERDAAAAPGDNRPDAPSPEEGLPSVERVGLHANGGNAAVVSFAGVDWPDAAATMRLWDRCCEALEMERRRSRSPPSPWSVSLSACGCWQPP